MTGIATYAGWRQAALAASVVALVSIALLFWRREAIADPANFHAAKAKGEWVPTLSFLSVPAVWMCFLFFFLITTAFGAIQNFATPILQALYGLSLGAAASALSTYLLGGAAGITLGGFLAQKGEHQYLIAGALGLAALLALLLAAGVLPAWAILPLMGCIGFCVGVAGPSRDLLVRRAATARFGQSAFGRIYGFVYSGLDLGLAMAPLIFGGFMDAKRFSAVLVGIAIMQTLSIFTALRVGKAT
jgi:predicted MFS family arabinose efflux permease